MTHSNLTYAPGVTGFMQSIADAAGDIMLQHYGKTSVSKKGDGSDLTPVDLMIRDMVRNRVERLSGLHLLTEESKDDLSRLDCNELFVVDELDGTHEFAHGGRDFSFLMAHVRGGRPTSGVVYQPALGRMFYVEEGQTPRVREDARDEHPLTMDVVPPIQRNWVPTRTSQLSPLQPLSETSKKNFFVGHSKNYRGESFDAMYAALGVPEGHRRVLGGGIGGRMMDVALGNTQVIPAYTNKGVKEWDTAAPEAILRAQGVSITDFHGRDLQYNKPDPRHTDGVLVVHPDLKDSVLEEMVRFAETHPF